MPVASQLTPSAVSWLSSSREDVQRSRSRRSRAQSRVQSFRSIMGKFTCVGVLYFGIYILCAEASSKSNNASLYRLPKNIIPESYDIFLRTNITRGDFSYKGVVALNLTVIKETKRVVLHSEYVKIIDNESVFQKILSNDSLQTIKINGQHHEEETLFYILTFHDNLTPGRYLLTLHFGGEVLNDVFGFYRSSYRVNNEVRWLGVTQFSPTFARRAFPCMDEPGFKATFKLRIGHYQNETVSSNTFEESREITDQPNYYITTFARTPRMSTYLLSWAIHGFYRVNSSDPRIWMWTQLDSSQLSWSLSSSPALVEGPKIYSALEDWMILKNPLHKVEHLAVPDFNFNAMENWGLITFRESAMLIRTESTSLENIRRILVTIAHEYAHTWFGNLVTPNTWNFAWLKEGFATYFSYFIITLVKEDWRMLNVFSLEVTRMSLLSDSMNHNKILNKKTIGSSKSAAGALDFVTYDKGATVIRMISEIMGEKLFKDAMQSYLKGKQFSSATPTDLYQHLESTFNSSSEAENVPVAIGEIIESWANQTHYPLIKVARVSSRCLRISQEIFLLDRSKAIEQGQRFWWIPINLMIFERTKSDQFVKINAWLGGNSFVDINLPENVTEDSLLLLNSRQINHYRVDYDSKNWEAILKLLNSENYQKLLPIDRATLIDDSFNMARADYKDYADVLKLAEYLSREIEYEPWVTASRAFVFLDNILQDRLDVRLALRRFVHKLITPIYKELSFVEEPSDSHIRKLQRNLILQTACYLGVEDCIYQAKSIFNDWIADENKVVPANLRDFVYCVGIFNGTSDSWMILWERFLKTNYYSEKEFMIHALMCTENSTLINKYLDFSIDIDTDLVKQYRILIVQNVILGRKNNVETLINYLEKNLDKIIKLRGIPFLEGIFSALGKEITSDENENKLSSFIKNNTKQLGKALEAARQASKSAKVNIQWINTHAPQIASYLNSTSIG